MFTAVQLTMSTAYTNFFWGPLDESDSDSGSDFSVFGWSDESESDDETESFFAFDSDSSLKFRIV